MIKEIPVVGAAILKNGKLLAAKRSSGRSLGGLWEFPGGKIEKDEIAALALKREIFEEFGAQSTIYQEFHDVFTKEYEFGKVILHVLYATLDSEITKTIEHEELRWVTTEEAMALEWAPTDVPAIEKLIERGFEIEFE